MPPRKRGNPPKRRPPRADPLSRAAAPRPAGSLAPGPGRYWMYGRHPVAAALANPRRRSLRLLLAEDAPGPPLAIRPPGVPVTMVPRPLFREFLPEDAVHQGLALEVQPLPRPDLAQAARRPEAATARLLLLDQVTDPRNLGAILRNAAAFAVDAVVVTARHAPAEGGALARAASGALERVPLVRVPNLARALDSLADWGYWRFGLDAAAAQSIDAFEPPARLALVLGSEGAGLRRLTGEHCDGLLRLPIAAGVESLNVATAAAVALYALRPLSDAHETRTKM